MQIKEQPNNIDRGLPLGNQSSQWFALFFLDRIDRLVKEELRIKCYVRYMDDFILIHRDKKYLQYCFLPFLHATLSYINLLSILGINECSQKHISNTLSLYGKASINLFLGS